MLWCVSRPLRSRSKPEGFILPCEPALADRPLSDPGWLHDIKFDGYPVIARKDGDRVRLRARTTSDDRRHSPASAMRRRVGINSRRNYRSWTIQSEPRSTC